MKLRIVNEPLDTRHFADGNVSMGFNQLLIENWYLISELANGEEN